MATRAYTQIERAMDAEWLVTWTGLLNGDDGTPFQLPRYADRCVQFNGTFGTGGSISLQGSLDGTNWFILTDPANAAITAPAARLRQVVEHTVWVRPIVTAGDGTTSLVCRLLLRAEQ